MIKMYDEVKFDFNSVENNTLNIYTLIEKIRNLQNCIIQELQNNIINKEYINECQLEINETLKEIYNL